jgi:hypothetical protein
MRRAEWPYIRKRRQKAGLLSDEHGMEETAEPTEDLTGLALSGGGIRSATFALGVLQALAGEDLLKRFDYLSTVSGGGYIGSSLTWFINQTAPNGARDADAGRAGVENAASSPPPVFGVGPSGSEKPLPYGTVDPRKETDEHPTPPERALLRYLRQHGNYLIPGEGITLTSGIVVVLRGMVLNLLVWLPIVTGIMLALSPFRPFCRGIKP